MRELDPNRWAARPFLAALLHGALVTTPVVVGIVVGYLVRGLLPADGLGRVPSWLVAGGAGTITVWLAQRAARRVVPLSWLLRMGMLFPGPAPSRFRVARDAGRLRTLEERLSHAAHQPDEVAAQDGAEMILSLVSALTAHDKRTRGHAERVRVFTDILSEQLGLPRTDRDRLRWAPLLHDIGKLEVSARILNKPGTPTRQEWNHLRRHPEAGHRLVASLRPWLGEWADTVLHHHERWDGAGYPAGLAGEQISLGARIVAVADAYDVMTSARSYKRPNSVSFARAELVSCAGSQFDPAIVRAFLLIPLPRLRWALGPLSWLSQLPWARDAVHIGAQVPAAASSAAAAAPAAAGAASVAAGLTFAPPPAAPPQPTIAAADEIAVVTAASSTAATETEQTGTAEAVEVEESTNDVTATDGLSVSAATLPPSDGAGPGPADESATASAPDPVPVERREVAPTRAATPSPTPTSAPRDTATNDHPAGSREAVQVKQSKPTTPGAQGNRPAEAGRPETPGTQNNRPAEADRPETPGDQGNGPAEAGPPATPVERGNGPVEPPRSGQAPAASPIADPDPTPSAPPESGPAAAPLAAAPPAGASPAGGHAGGAVTATPEPGPSASPPGGGQENGKGHGKGNNGA